MSKLRISFAAKTADTNIDIENKSISSVILAKVGEAKGHGVNVELSFLKDLVKFYNKSLKKDGLKCNFGHNWNNLGLQLGKFKNVRLEGDCVLGDLEMYEAANASPIAPGMADFVLKMGEEDATSIMCSIVFNVDYHYQYDENKKQVKVYYYDEDGRWVSANRKMKVYVAFGELYSCDIVDQGALTETLYSSSGAMQTAFNDIINAEQFASILEENHESFTVLNDFYAKKTKPSLFKQMKDFFNADQSDDTNEALTTLQSKHDQQKTELDALKAKFEALEKENTALSQKETDNAEIIQNQKNRIIELEAKPAGEHTRGPGEDEDAETDLYMNDPINQRALKKFGKNKKSK